MGQTRQLAGQDGLCQMIKAVCFDLGGTLLLEQGEGFSARVVRLSGLPASQVRAALVKHFYLQERPLEETVHAFCRELDIPDSDSFMGQLSAPVPKSRLFPDVYEALKMLAGYRLATISNLTPWNHSHVLDVEAAGMFETEVVSYKVHYAKPDARIFKLVEQRLGLAPEEIVMVGDSPHDDIAGAKKAAWKAIHLTRQEHTCLPDPEADAVIDSLRDIRQIIKDL